MAKDRKKLQHIHSSVPDKQPTPATLEVGEIAVNNAKDQEFLSIKNSENEVVRFSSDEQIITWTEKKEVMPYKGYVRGEDGPASTSGDSPSADTYGSYGITDNDLLTNKSNIVIKINQVAANNTVKHDKVNGAKDKYNNEVNPTDDGGLTDGAGFYIDMSRYAMQGANPSFSSITTTCNATLKGTTTIEGTDGECGSEFNIVNIDNVCFNINDTFSAYGKLKTNIGTSCDGSDTSNETIIKGKKILIGTTDTDIDSCNKISAKTDNYTLRECTDGSGNTTIDVTNINVDSYNIDVNSCKKFNVKSNDIVLEECENGIGKTLVKSCSGITLESKNIALTKGDCAVKGQLTIETDDLCLVGEDKANLYGNVTNVGIDCDDTTIASATSVYGETLNVSASTANTTVTSANTNFTATTTNITAATTTIGSANTTVTLANTTATTANYSGTTLNSTINNVTHSGQTLNVTEDTTDITSCGHLYFKTNDFKLEQCDGSKGLAELKFCSGFTVDSDRITLQQCGDNGSILIKEKDATISGTTLTVNEDNVTITASENACVDASDKASMYGANQSDLGINCGGNDRSTLTRVSGDTVNEGGNIVNTNAEASINETAPTINESASTSINETAQSINETASGSITEKANNDIKNIAVAGIYESATTINETASSSINERSPYIYEIGGTEIKNVAPTINVSGNTTNISGTSNVKVVGNDICISGGTEASIGAKSVKIGTDCAGNTIASGITAISSTEISLSSQTINNSGTTNNNTFNTINNTATNENNNITNINQNGNTYNVTANTEAHSTTSFTVNSTTSACIVSNKTAGIGGDEETNIGTDCQGNPISDVTNIYGDIINITAPTINQSGDTYNITGDTNISGDTYISGNITIGTQCSQLSSDTVADSFCEVFNRSKVTMTRESDPSDSGLSAVYKIFQDGSQIGYDINVPKDGFLKNVELVDDHTQGIYELHFVWNIYDADTQTYTTGETYVNLEDLVKDIDENNTKADRGVDVDVWYNETSKMMNVSADTTVVIKNADGLGTKTFSKANATHTLSAYTLNSVSGDVKSISANTNLTYDPFVEKKNIVIPTDANHINRKTVSWSYGDVKSASGSTYDPGDGTINTIGDSRTMSFVIPKCVGDLNRHKITFSSGDVSSFDSQTFDPGNDCANSAETINIPTCVSHLNRHMVTFQSGDVRSFSSSTTYDPGSDCSNSAETINIPTSLKHLSEYNGTCYVFDENVCMTNNTIVANSFYNSSDINLKENIASIGESDFEKVNNIDFKSFNFKADESKTKTYGVIAQDVQNAGLNEIVQVNGDGNLSVDYISLLILKIGSLENEIKKLKEELNKK